MAFARVYVLAQKADPISTKNAGKNRHSSKNPSEKPTTVFYVS